MRPSLIWKIAIAVSSAAAIASLLYVLQSIGARPLDGVEGEVLFEAARIRGGLALYTDPLQGVFDYGPVPSRYYVLYPPVWSWLLSWVPLKSAPMVARAIGAFCWFGLLATIAARSKEGLRARAGVIALFVAGVYTLTLYGASGRPDSVAIALAGAGLLRTMERGKVDMGAAALFALAPFVKPNVMGLAAGAFAVQLLLSWRVAARAAAAALFVCGAVGFVLQLASGGQWIAHLRVSTLQGAMFSHWAEQVPSRLQFLGLPIAAAMAVAYRARKSSPQAALALGAMVSSLLWTLVALAKIGSATNYWMEPMVAVTIVAGFVPFALPMEGRLGWAAACAALFQALWTGVGGARSSLEAIDAVREHAKFVASVRQECQPGLDEVVLADEPGLELMLNGRAIMTPFQSTHAVRAGRFPVEAWAGDVLRPEATCLLMEDDLLERPLGQVSIEHDRFDVTMRTVLKSKFQLKDQRAGWRLYRSMR